MLLPYFPFLVSNTSDIFAVFVKNNECKDGLRWTWATSYVRSYVTKEHIAGFEEEHLEG